MKKITSITINRNAFVEELDLFLHQELRDAAAVKE